MVEPGRHELVPVPATLILPEEEPKLLDQDEFLGYMADHITPEMLVADRDGQARLASVLSNTFYSGPKDPIEEARERIHNPVPPLTLTRGGSTTYIYSAFRLHEPKGRRHYYFFRQSNPAEACPPYLRPEDIVRSGTYTTVFPEEARKRMATEGIDDATFLRLCYTGPSLLSKYGVLAEIPFNKAFERVARKGGPAERFNYVTKKWELSGDYCDSPLKIRVARAVRATLVSTGLLRR